MTVTSQLGPGSPLIRIVHIKFYQHLQLPPRQGPDTAVLRNQIPKNIATTNNANTSIKTDKFEY